jgi:hypothetical protein
MAAPSIKALFTAFLIFQCVALADSDFEAKLNVVLQNTEKSVKLLRKQITESQSAPFLPDLYLQLGELLSDRSNTLYYLQMERQKDDAAAPDKELSPVIAAQQEAITVYRMILKDFPTFDKRKVTIYRMALAQKSIDDTTEFIRSSGQLLKEYPDSEEAMGARLLMAQSYFDRQDYKAASDLLFPILASPYAYERNLAKYRLGLIDIAQEHFKEALGRFEEVIKDPQLKDQDNPYELSYKSKRVKSDLKREALIDSLRAYTHVYEKNADPVSYYERLAPTEIHFHEIIEKLSLRYISLKKYDEAIKLLRTLSERTADPQKVINIYEEVLLTIPVKDRVQIPADEIRFLIDKYNLWVSYYQISPAVMHDSYNFFEKQVRELGTTSHVIAKNEGTKSVHWKRARDFYLLYLGYFRKTKNAAKMAANLGDVYFAMGDYLKSGEYYLRTFSGEFGAPAEKRALIENALLCLQKKANYSFYETLRLRGLVIRSVEGFFAFDAKKKSDPDLNFLLVKTEYEQNFFPAALNNLFSYMKNFKREKHAVDAGEMLLDYFNTRNDFAAMESWSTRILALKIPNEPFNQKVARIQKQAKSKVIYEKVRSLAGYDDFAQGKSYLTAALSGDSSINNIALQEALSKSRSEGDYQTFLKAAALMADKEPKKDKKVEILTSVGREHAKVTEYYQACNDYLKIAKNASFPNPARVQATEDALNVALLLRDWSLLKTVLRQPTWREITPAAKTRLRDQLIDLVDSPAFSADFAPILFSLGLNDSGLLALYKAQYRIDPSLRANVLQEVSKRCKTDVRKPFCFWQKLGEADAKKNAFVQSLTTLPATMQAIQSSAQGFMQASGVYHQIEGSGDPLLESVVAMRNGELYSNFGDYLKRAASQNADLKPVLTQKAQETFTSAKAYQETCRLTILKSLTFRAVRQLCATSDRSPATKELLEWEKINISAEPPTDPADPKLVPLKKKVFSAKDAGDALLDLAKTYYDGKNYRHAAATSSYGIALYKQNERDFRAILGCSVMRLGFYAEADYHLTNASAYEGMAETCKKELPH